MVAYSGIAGIPVRQGNTDTPDLAASTSEQSIILDPRVIPYFATTTTRDAAYAAAIAGTTPYASPQLGMRCYVHAGPSGYPDWCGWNGTEWLWDNPAPIQYVMNIGVSPAFNNTAQSGWTTSAWTFTPSRTGMAYVGFDAEMQGVTASWGACFAYVRKDGSVMADSSLTLMYEDVPTQPRRIREWTCRIPVWFVKNVNVGLSLDVNQFSATGNWRFNNFTWRVTQY